MEAATHYNNTFVYRQQPRHTRTPFLFLPPFVEEGIKAQHFTLLALCLLTEQSITGFSHIKLTAQPNLSAYCQHLHFQDFVMLPVHHEHGRVHT